ncbi:helix-turn-helix domain-containing protein [Phreatobacter sp. AB_2022a]|uniref:helix-turn-helix domain-containing protein n=1 Tax=Phreatobacter sp. AB_2022a TaxID=3003134 RepID=UPI00228767D0|nr:helix-turn-helix domain-containing protein [Phreatobacter sp. AB_2022a]MCZ0734573.1 helix-turn-helix domain-containing protein [Phreatobacter sp. AB_2022a]
MTEEAKLGKIYTTDEAAERLRLTRRAIIKLARQHGQCSRVGRDYLFSEADLLALWQALREPPVERRVTAVPVMRPKIYEKALEVLRWSGNRPPTKADRRELEILRRLESQKGGKSYKQIPRAGETTVRRLLKLGFVMQCGEDSDGRALIRVAPEGRDQLRIAERWEGKRKAR